jgi:hypothetical protein
MKKALLLMLLFIFISTNALSQNFIQGKITGAVQEGISVKLYKPYCGSDAVIVDTITTNTNGYYGFGCLDNGTYSVVPDYAGYYFNPEYEEVAIPQTEIQSYDFVASGIYTISGTVSGDIQEGVTITLSGDDSETTITASAGSYSFTDLVSGSYTITPRSIAYTFDPESSTVEIINTNVIGIDFTAISGCNYVDRFVDDSGTVTDCRTGLVWLKNANCFNQQIWDNAMSSAAGLNSGECGLTDGSVEGDWRLPKFEELSGIKADSLTGNPNNPSSIWTIPEAPFFNVQHHYYWSTTNCSATGQAWFSAVGLDSACASATFDDQYVWPVRQPIDTGEMVF